MSEKESTSIPRVRPRPNIPELIGNRYGHLTIIRQVPSPSHRKGRFVLCDCDCGEAYTGWLPNILDGTALSCGRQVHRVKHGHAIEGNYSRTYRIWDSMIQRGTNSARPNADDYVNRGITIEDERWLKFANFLEDMGEPPSNKHSIERRNNSVGYSKSNCYWATPSQQGRNTRQNHLITFKDRTMCITEWAEETGLTHKVISYRLGAGWSVEETLTTPRLPRSQIRTWRKVK